MGRHRQRVRTDRSDPIEESGRHSVIMHLVHSDSAAAPIAGGPDPFGIGAEIRNEPAAQVFGDERLARHPGIEFAGGHFERRECFRQCIAGASRRSVTVHPGHGHIRFGVERDFVGRSIHLAQCDHSCPGRQFGEAPRDCRQSGLVGDQQVPVVGVRDHERAARPAKRQRLAGLRLHCPARCRPGIVNGEIDFQRIVGAVETARREIAPDRVGGAVGACRAVGKEQLDVIVEAETGEAVEIAGQGNADHVRGDLVDLLDRQHAAARLVTHTARHARINVLRRGEGGDGH